jgi:autophagy-related protein 2
MTYLLPSFLQKRILRYALSQLDLLEADAIDLDNLEIVWGKRSTVELKDLDIRVEVMSSLDSTVRCPALS